MMKNNNKFFYFCVFYALSNTFTLQAMEKTEYAIAQDWGYKKRDNKSLCCCKDTDDKKYPYFLSIEGTGDMLSERRDITEKYHEMFGKDCDIEKLNREEKRTLAYLLETIQENEKSGIQALRIEGRDKDFAQKMSLRVKKLPLQIRQTIIAKYGENMMSNIFYQPSFFNTIMDNEDNKDHCALTIAGGVSYLCYWLQKWCCPITPPIAIPPYSAHNPDEWENFRVVTTLGCYYCLYPIVRNCLRETAEQKDKRHDFAVVPLLKEMECKIVDAKEKVD
jgi:hypothetical protein